MRIGCLVALVLVTLGCASDPTPSASEGSEPPALEPVPKEPEPGLGAAVADAIEDARVPDDLLLLPEGPTMLIGLDLAAFIAKPQWRMLASQLGPREREQLSATEACGVGPRQWRRVLLGLDPQSNGAAILVEAVGVGTPEILRCLRDRIGTFELAADAKTMRDDTGGGIVLDDNTIVFAGPRWMDPLRERLEDRGPPAYDGALKQATARAGFGHAAWLGMVPPAEMKGVLVTTIGAEVDELSGSIDTTAEGYVIELELTTASTMMAALRIEGQLAVLGSLAQANGIPSEILETVKVEQQDGRVRIELSATDEQVDEIVAALRDRP